MIPIHRPRIARPISAALALTVASVIAAGCGSSSSSSGGTTGSGVAGQSVPTASLPVLKTIGKGEGQLNLIASRGL